MKSFGAVEVVRGLDLYMAPGSIFALLGRTPRRRRCRRSADTAHRPVGGWDVCRALRERGTRTGNECPRPAITGSLGLKYGAEPARSASRPRSDTTTVGFA